MPARQQDPAAVALLVCLGLGDLYQSDSGSERLLLHEQASSPAGLLVHLVQGDLARYFARNLTTWQL